MTKETNLFIYKKKTFRYYAEFYIIFAALEIILMYLFLWFKHYILLYFEMPWKSFDYLWKNNQT